jgi:signal transduction histidine kinase/ActR/RegA family two-component response regulator
MLLVTYFSGSDAPGWLLCFSAVTATRLMVGPKYYRVVLMASMVLVATFGSLLAAKPLLVVATIFVTLLAFTVILNRVLGYVLMQNQALHRAREAVEKASQAQSRFLSNMNHELRTPMNGVLGSVELLAATDTSKQQRQYINILQTSGEHLLHIINDILDISKIGSGKFIIDAKPFELKQNINGLVKLFEAPLKEQGNRLTIAIDDKVPPMVKADPLRLKQLLINIVGNANKFTKDGHIQVKVGIESRQGNSLTLLVAVSDNGIGIAPEKQQSIFEAFSQADESTTRDYGGTGLGLTICKQLVNNMHGRIWVESEPGNGSTFFFTFNVDKVETVAETVVELRIESGQSLLGDKQPLDILVAEDNMVNQAVIVNLLANLGYQVDVANNGEEAIEAYENKRYDLIFMDIQMPKMDGLEASRIIKKKTQSDERPVIVAMTANRSPEDVQAFLAAGMLAHFGKPVEITKISDFIEQQM